MQLTTKELKFIAISAKEAMNFCTEEIEKIKRTNNKIVPQSVISKWVSKRSESQNLYKKINREINRREEEAK